jgi:hypothetical protein
LRSRKGSDAVQSGKAAKAIEALAPAVPYELGSPAQALRFSLYPAYLPGLAYVAAHQSSAAAAEFQKITDHPYVVQSEPIAALAHHLVTPPKHELRPKAGQGGACEVEKLK